MQPQGAPASKPAPTAEPVAASKAEPALAKGSVTAAAEVAAAQVDSSRARAAATAPTEEPSSPLRLALLSMAFLAASVLVIVGLVSASRGSTRGPDPQEVAKRYGLPDPAPAQGEPSIYFVDPVSNGSLSGALGALSRGPVVAIFAKPGTTAGDESAALAAEVHRRLHGLAAKVLLVVPRESVAGSAAADQVQAARAALSKAGVEGDVAVALDPTSAFRRARRLPGDDPVAILLLDGREVLRASPVESDEPLLLSHVGPLVSEAMKSAPR
jgi:hypothetical protein